MHNIHVDINSKDSYLKMKLFRTHNNTSGTFGTCIDLQYILTYDIQWSHAFVKTFKFVNENA